MCIIVFRPADKPQVSLDTLEICWQNNSDGCGFAYCEGDRLKLHKFLTFEAFVQTWETVRKMESPFLYHFRTKTHGLVNLDNCHPFRIDRDHVFAHNGVIPDCAEVGNSMSDTALFKTRILSGLPKGWFNDFGTKILIENYIGSSKIVVLTSDRKYKIYNELKGEWSDDIWYSNSGYKRAKVQWDGADMYKCGGYGWGGQIFFKTSQEQWKRKLNNNFRTKKHKAPHILLPSAPKPEKVLTIEDIESVDPEELHYANKVYDSSKPECSWCAERFDWLNRVILFGDTWEICDECLKEVKDNNGQHIKISNHSIIDHYYPGN